MLTCARGSPCPGSNAIPPMSDWLSFLSSQSTLIGLGTVAAATAYYIASRPMPFQSLVDLDNQSIELPV